MLQDPDTIFVGTRPDAFRSHDGGKSWEALSLGVTLPCPIGIPRTTNMIVDPRDHRIVWAGIEVDGVYQSRDGGDNWVHLPALGPDPFQGDIHGLALRTGRRQPSMPPRRLASPPARMRGELEVSQFPQVPRD